jgi:hypothetical protein
MSDNKFKEHFMGVPIEKHDTAAWQYTEDLKPISKVFIPTKTSVRDAKDWVDSNQK